MLMFVLSAGEFSCNVYEFVWRHWHGNARVWSQFNSRGIICASFRPRVWNTFVSLSVKPKLISYWQPTANINNGWCCGWMLETPKVLDRTCLRRYRGSLCLHLKIPSSLWRVLFVRLLREDKHFWSLSNRQLFSVKGYLVVIRNVLRNSICNHLSDEERGVWGHASPPPPPSPLPLIKNLI